MGERPNAAPGTAPVQLADAAQSDTPQKSVDAKKTHPVKESHAAKSPNASSVQGAVSHSQDDGSKAKAHPSQASSPPARVPKNGAPIPEDEPPVPEDQEGTSFFVFTALPSWVTSSLVHVIALLVLALLTLPPVTQPNRENELVLSDASEELTDDLELFQEQALDSLELADVSDPTDVLLEAEELIVEDIVPTPAMDLAAAPVQVELNPFGDAAPFSEQLGLDIGVVGGDALAGRGAASRARLVREGGGTAGSEKAVAGGLKWIQQHQLADGGWSIDHKSSPLCQGRCPDIGKKKATRNGATALALLPFLGTGQTHLEGEYRETVAKGLKYLIRNLQWSGPRASLVDAEGTYYSHGLCAIVLCEAYAMSDDETLLGPAQAVINEIAWAQDPAGGGWRYKPQSPGDTSVVGFQVMALKSAHMAYLNVPKPTIEGVERFLEAVQSKKGSNYGYTSASDKWRYSTASVGLLLRMYLGWKKSHPAIVAGVTKLAEKGPSEGDIYYNYYATQVMRHYGGEEWRVWNEKMRDQLVNSQAQEGHAAGSWYFHGGHANESGGRLYCTSMATMILEVYYRHLPLYQKEAAEQEFPL